MAGIGKEGVTFRGICVVSCGVLRKEVLRLRDEGFLDADEILFTAAGLHEWPWLLQEQLPRQIEKAKAISQKIIVLYGEKCFIDTKDPTRITEVLIREHSPTAVRVNAKNCVDVLASQEERDAIAGGDKVYWLTPGWVANWDFIFKDWDEGKANETFPAHDRAVILDAIGFFDELIVNDPERVLKISDWMKIPLDAAPVTLDRMKMLLAEKAKELNSLQ